MAARIIVAIENPADVCVISARPYSQVGQLSLTQFILMCLLLKFLKLQILIFSTM
jgi:hypothetical protein